MKSLILSTNCVGSPLYFPQGLLENVELVLEWKWIFLKYQSITTVFN